MCDSEIVQTTNAGTSDDTQNTRNKTDSEDWPWLRKTFYVSLATMKDIKRCVRGRNEHNYFQGKQVTS